jgi:hypothetical protein
MGLSWANRKVISLPLRELWDANGPIAAERGANLGRAEIRGLLRDGPTVMIVANVGEPLVWIESPKVFDFWKKDVKYRLVEGVKARLDDFPGGYAYYATRWSFPGGGVLVLLEMWH